MSELQYESVHFLSSMCESVYVLSSTCVNQYIF